MRTAVHHFRIDEPAVCRRIGLEVARPVKAGLCRSPPEHTASAKPGLLSLPCHNWVMHIASDPPAPAVTVLRRSTPSPPLSSSGCGEVCPPGCRGSLALCLYLEACSPPSPLHRATEEPRPRSAPSTPRSGMRLRLSPGPRHFVVPWLSMGRAQVDAVRGSTVPPGTWKVS
jgi:hypothetical protein